MILIIHPGFGTGLVGEVEGPINDLPFELIHPLQYVPGKNGSSTWLNIVPWTDRITVRPASWVEAPIGICVEYREMLKRLKAKALGVVIPGEGL